MQTPAERARKDACREWIRTACVGKYDPRPIINASPHTIGIAEEAFVAGWNARDKVVEEIRE